jgi:hypothetical protein
MKQFRCWSCEQVKPVKYTVFVKTWDSKEGNFDYYDYYLCSETCLYAFLRRNLFKLIGKDVKILEEQDD